MSLQKNEQHYTYSDYASWNDNKRWELIDGTPYMMSPAPSPRHQEILGRLYFQIESYLKGKSCRAYLAPFDVRLNADGADNTIVQPDLTVICDKSKIDDTGCKGSPDLVIEILSPSTARHDRMVKFQQYLQAQVKEYWIVDPDTETVQVHVLSGYTYTMHMYSDTNDSVPISVLESCTVNLQEVFGE